MKKIISIGALMLVTVIACSAKTTDDKNDGVRIGAKIGFNFANVYDSKGDNFNADPKFGLALGGFLVLPLGEKFGLQPELLFSQKGFEGSGRVLGFDYSFKRTTNYLDIPIYLALKPSESVTILAGPQFSYLLSKKDVFNSPFANAQQEQEFKNENYRKNTLGVSLGVDIAIDNLVLGARANWDLQTNNGDGTSSTPRYKNQWLQATIGFKF